MTLVVKIEIGKKMVGKDIKEIRFLLAKVTVAANVYICFQE